MATKTISPLTQRQWRDMQQAVWDAIEWHTEKLSKHRIDDYDDNDRWNIQKQIRDYEQLAERLEVASA